VKEEVNSNVLLSNSEPVVSSSESLTEKSPASLESSQLPSSSVPSSSGVQDPVLDSAAEVSASNVSLNVSLQTPPQSDDGLLQQSTSDAVVQNSSSNVSLTADNVQTPEQKTPQPEPVIPTISDNRRQSGPLLLDLKRQRARERQERMLQRSSQSPNSNSIGPLASKTNGTITNGVDGASHRPVTDNATYIGTRHRYSNRYDIAAPDDTEKCCVVM